MGVLKVRKKLFFVSLHNLHCTFESYSKLQQEIPVLIHFIWTCWTAWRKSRYTCTCSYSLVCAVFMQHFWGIPTLLKYLVMWSMPCVFSGWTHFSTCILLIVCMASITCLVQWAQSTTGDQGKYCCRVWNKAGFAMSNTVNITVGKCGPCQLSLWTCCLFVGDLCGIVRCMQFTPCDVCPDQSNDRDLSVSRADSERIPSSLCTL